MAGIIGNIGQFDENVEQWSLYTERFEYFLQANAIEGEKIVPTFLSVMGAKTFTLLRSLVQPRKPGESTYAEIVAVLSAHFSPKPLVIAERFRFHKRNQEEGETITMFVAALKKLSEHCEFGDVLNDTLRDRLVCGLRSEAIQKRLLSESNLTLQKATEISVGMELAAKEAQHFSSSDKVYKLSADMSTFQKSLGKGNTQCCWLTVRMVSRENTELRGVLGKHTDVFKDELGTLKDITAKLDIKPDGKAKCCKARPVPYAIRSKVETALEDLVTSGVIVPVSNSEWATPIVPVLKKDGSIRICGDFKITVNPILSPDQYPLPLIDDLFAGLAGGKRFSKLDLSQAYLQMKVDENSRELLTIVTHKGLFRYQRLPFGITSAPSLFQRAMDQVLSGLSGVQCYLDDILVTGKTEAEHLSNLDGTLQRLKEYGLRVRKDKCEFFKQSVEYLGHVIDADGLHKAPSKVRAVLEAPAPQNTSQLRSFIALLNYYGRFVNGLAALLKPLHQLLCRNQSWKWTQQCETTFQEAKKALVKSGVLTHFNPKLPLKLACDASPYGVGAVISHIMPSGEERPIAFASGTLNKAESKYAQIEREALGIIFGVRKFHQYLYGRQFTLLTDHRPLTTILGPHTGIPSLAASRMQRWALLLSAHTYEIRYRKAEQHGNADGLSRLPLPVTCPESKQKDNFYFEQVTVAPVTSTQVRRSTRNDPILSAVMEMVKDGHVPKDTINLKPYLSRKNELSFHSGCLLWGQRVIIPPSLRKPVLQQLHVGHCGIVRMKEIARSYFWWPGLEGDIEGKAKSCPSCQQVRNDPQLAPLHPWDWPETPLQRVHVDFAGPVEGKMLLIAVDAHSKWPEVVVMHSTTAEKTVVKLGEMFSHFGYPEQLVSDNGPQFTSQEFAVFLQQCGVQHIKSAPYHPATNGLAERMVQTIKHALKTSQRQGSLQQRLNDFLLSYRNTSHGTTKVSPASLMLKRSLRSGFDLLKPSTVKEVVARQQQKQFHRRNMKAKSRLFHPGQNVLARNYTSGSKWVPATVIAQTGPVSYTVLTSDKLIWKRHLDQLLLGSDTEVESAVVTPTVCSDYPMVPEVTVDTPLTPEKGPAPPEPENSPQKQNLEKQPDSGSNISVSESMSNAERRYPIRERRPPKRLDL
ncbi:uncharacterized protein K02A2.6-like [Pimephales promelas]|uniref:uncharacterized protein K02A2.6-like n=1 Tax=Pimephales promelas TaxID=90988 RepID=UPI001955567F|nr:uncharacterized protein K02A2.6-like [Pimephales promelas]